VGGPPAGARDPFRGTEWLVDSFLIQDDVLLVIRRKSSVEQQPVGDRAGPPDRAVVVRRRRPHLRRGGWIVARVHPMPPELIDLVVVCGKLVARAHLPQ